jgi:hypothetical protein
MNNCFKHLWVAVLFTSLALFSGCSHTKAQTLPPPVQRLSNSSSSSTLPTLPADPLDPLQASGQSTGLTLLGFIKLFPPSTQKARASLFSAIGRDISDTTVTLQKPTVESSERNYFIFSLPRIRLAAEVVRSVPVPLPTGNTIELPDAPLRKGVPVFPSR